MITPDIITVAAALVICLRLLTFRRGGHRVRRSISCAAWLLIVGAGSVGIRTLAGTAPPADWGTALVFVILAGMLVRGGGNLANVTHCRRRV